MPLSSTHDFYLGRGPDAQWLGSVYLEGCACSALAALREATTADEFAGLVLDLLNDAEAHAFGMVAVPSFGWPWPWPTSHGTDYTYAFHDGTVWRTEHGQRWSLRAGSYLPPGPDEQPVVFPQMRPTCGYTGIDAADTLSRRYGPLLGDTFRLDLRQLGVRILADLTLPNGLRLAQDTPFAQLPPHLRYGITTHESTVELEIDVFGLHDGDPDAFATQQLLATLPARYGWTDLDGGPPRFGVRVLIADHGTSHPALADHDTHAVITHH